MLRGKWQLAFLHLLSVEECGQAHCFIQPDLWGDVLIIQVNEIILTLVIWSASFLGQVASVLGEQLGNGLHLLVPFMPKDTQGSRTQPCGGSGRQKRPCPRHCASSVLHFFAQKSHPAAGLGFRGGGWLTRGGLTIPGRHTEGVGVCFLKTVKLTWRILLF